MLEKMKLNFIDELNLGDFYTIKNLKFDFTANKFIGMVDIYKKNQQIHIDIRDMKDSTEYLLHIIFNKSGYLEYAFVCKEEIIVSSYIVFIINLLNKDYSNLPKQIQKIKNLNESPEVFPPYYFKNEEIKIDQIYINYFPIKILDLGFDNIFNGYIIRKYTSLFYVVVNSNNEIVCVVKLKTKNDKWYLIDSYFMKTHLDPSLVLESFFLTSNETSPLDENKNLNEEKIQKLLKSLNIYL